MVSLFATQRIKMPSIRDRLLSQYELFPFHRHPLWLAVQEGSLSYAQLMAAESQHWIRTKAGQNLRREALDSARVASEKIFSMLLETYLEECTDDSSGPSHLDLIERLVVSGGVSREALAACRPTPGNAAAIALYRDIGRRGAGCHMIGAGAVEHYYSQLAPKIFDVYTTRYGMTNEQAETYRIHGPMDATHADRAFSILDEAANLHGIDVIEASVRDAFVATSLHYDGMLHAATGVCSYWDGRTT